MSWNDDIGMAVNGVIDNFNATGKTMLDCFNFLMQERSQLYGTVIYLMKKYNNKELIISIDERKQISTNDYIYFTPTQSNGLKVELKEQEPHAQIATLYKYDEEDNGSESV